jgi:hypothetical protein
MMIASEPICNPLQLKVYQCQELELQKAQLPMYRVLSSFWALEELGP